MDLLSLLTVLLLIGVVLYLVGRIPMDPDILKIIRALVLVAVCLWLINLLLGPIRIPIRRG